MEKPSGEVDNHLPASSKMRAALHRSDTEQSPHIAYSDHARHRSLTLPVAPAISSPQASLALQQSRSRAIRPSIPPVRQPQGPTSGKKSMRASLQHGGGMNPDSQENVGPANHGSIDKLLQSDKTLQQIAASMESQASATSIPARLVLPPPGFSKINPVVVTKDAVFGVEQLATCVSKLDLEPGQNPENKAQEPAKSRTKTSLGDKKPPAINTTLKGLGSSAPTSPTSLASPFSTSSLQNSLDTSKSSSPLVGPMHIKHTLYKTELCRSYEETGHCRYSNKCQFAHGEAELRPVQRHPKYKTEICRTYWERGDCPYGKRCCFIHNEVDKLKSKDLVQSNAALSGLKGAADYATGATETAASSPDSSRVGTPALATGGPSTPTTVGFGGTISLGSNGVDLTRNHPQPLRESRLPEPGWLNGHDWYYRNRQPMYEFELAAPMDSSPNLGAQPADFARETEFLGRDLFSTFNLSKDATFDDYTWVRPRAQSDASLVNFGGWNTDFHNIGRFKQVPLKQNGGAKGEKSRLPVFRHLC